MSDPRVALIKAASRFYERGWMMGTAGNLSARLPDGTVWITASGRPKGDLGLDDFTRVDPGGAVLERPKPGIRPSAETSIHLAIYRRFPEANACFHVHTVESNLVCQTAAGSSLALPPLEMLKGLGVPDEEPRVTLPLFANHAHVPTIAQEILASLEAAPPAVPGLLIRNHGLTTWASSTQAAFDQVELFEYIFRYLVVGRMSGMLAG